MTDSPTTRKSDRAEEVRLQQETLQHMKDLMREAVREGVRELVNEENMHRFWGAGVTMLQAHATQHAGRFVLGGLLGLLRKAVFFLVLGGAVYAFGGWGALAALVKAMFTTSGPT